jgi:hypothetical protein
MMTKDEALKMAIKALLYGTDHTKAVKACKEALEQPTSNIDYDLYRNVDRPVNPEGHKK